MTDSQQSAKSVDTAQQAGKEKPVPNKQLRYERIRRGWTQKEVADKLDTIPLTISRWESGTVKPGPHARQKLMEIFEKSARELGFVYEADMTSREPSLTSLTAASTDQSDSPYWNIPYRRNLFFTGREDILAHMHDVLSPDQPVALVQPQAISGLGGIGKTQTAIEYAYRYRDSYATVLWARAESADTLTTDFLTIASLLRLPERNDQDQSKVVEAVLRWLDTHERWLLILDNADNVEMVSDFMPSANKGHILLTTRAQSTGTIAERIEIEEMSVEEGTLFLLRRIKRLHGNAPLESVPSLYRSQAQAIVSALTGLPLALDQAGAYIEETGCSLSDYLKFYKTRSKRLLKTRGKDAAGHPEPVATTWSLSFEKIERANPAAAELLRLCAFLSPDAIPERMVREGASELGDILRPIAEDDFDLNEAIRELRKYSLIKRDEEEGVLNLHRLVQAVIRDGMNEEAQKTWVERTVRMVNTAFPDVEYETWPICQRYLAHAQVCAALIEQWHMKSQEAIALLKKIDKYLYDRAQYAESEHYIQSVLALQEELLGPVHPQIALLLNELVDVKDAQGKYDDILTLLQRALAIQEATLPADHRDISSTLNNFGALLMRQGKSEQAVPYFQRAVAISEQALGEHSHTAGRLTNLATIYRILHQYEQAEPLMQRALTMNEKLLGSEHPTVAQALNNLGGIYNEQRKYEQAEPLFQRALYIHEKTLGAEHPLVAFHLNNISFVQLARGNKEEAETLMLRALALFEHAFGTEHPDTARTLKNLGKIYMAQERYEEAEKLYAQSLAIRERVLGAEHPLVALTLEDYAKLLHTMGKEHEAVALEARAQAIRGKTA